MQPQWPQEPSEAGEGAPRAGNGAANGAYHTPRDERVPARAPGAPNGADQRDEQNDDFAHEVRVDAIDVTQTVHEGLPLIGQRKALLDDVSITLLPGTFVAIVGASGSGKTTLLRALSGQTRGQEGDVFYNGLNMLQHRHHFSTTMGYVPQDDIVHKNLTVEAALYYAARLRLSCRKSRRELFERVDQVLEDVELTEQRRQLISKLSGGQRKRVNIALELLGRPAIFYLDEPTSGLDPGLDLKMMELLRRLADRGQTVVLVTHTTDNIDLCDDICFLAPGGRVAYYGPPDRLKQFFKSDDYAHIFNLLYDDPDYWVMLFRHSPDFAQYVEQPRQQAEALANGNGNGNGKERDSAPLPPEAACANSLRQFWVLTRRYLNVMVHDLPTLALLLLQAPIIGILIWLLAQDNVLHNVAAGVLGSDGNPQDIYAQRVLFILITSAIWFGIINAAREIVKEAPIYRREHAVNLGSVPYVLSKIVVLGALLAIQDFVLLYIVGTQTSFPANGRIWHGQSGAFIEIYLTLLLVSFVGLMLGLLTSALVPNSDRALSIVPVLLIPQIIFANVIFNIDGNFGRWISYIMPSRWGVQAAGTVARIHDRFSGHTDHPFFATDAPHLVGFWLILVILVAAYFSLILLAMRRKDDKDEKDATDEQEEEARRNQGNAQDAQNPPAARGMRQRVATGMRAVRQRASTTAPMPHRTPSARP
jgi:ABC-type multidrug transport system ATPase subunit